MTATQLDALAPEKKEPPDFWAMHARKLLGMPDTWRWLSLKYMDGGGGRRFCVVVGAVPDGVLLKSGPRKGEVNWKHRHDERQVIIDFAEHEKFIAAWEVETGTCSRCYGTGQQEWGWGKETGTRYRPCPYCATTGKAGGR